MFHWKFIAASKLNIFFNESKLTEMILFDLYIRLDFLTALKEERCSSMDSLFPFNLCGDVGYTRQ